LAHLLEDEGESAFAVAAEAPQHEDGLGDLKSILDAAPVRVRLVRRPGYEFLAAHARPRLFECRSDVDGAPVGGRKCFRQLSQTPALQFLGESCLVESQLKPGCATV
jgi:hypothetical protein